QALFTADLSLGVRALVDGEIAGPRQRPGAQGCGNRLFGSQSSLEPTAPLGKSPPGSPVEAEAGGDPQRRLRILMRQPGVERGSKVCDLGIDEVEPSELCRSMELAVGLLGEGEEAGAMPCLNLAILSRTSRPLDGVLPNGLEHPVSRTGLVVDDQRLRHQGAQQVKHVCGVERGPGADLFGKLQAEAPSKD